MQGLSCWSLWEKNYMRLSSEGKLRLAARTAFLVGGVSLAATTAYAQEAAPAAGEAAAEGSVNLDKLVVTGTRIKSQTFTASSPVAEIKGEEFRYAGATIAEDLVNQYPQLSPEFDNVNNNPSLGYATVDLRGLGPERTLALLNGRRIPKGAGELPDISIIPATLIKRVDVLTGGASAVYGSDAVAGVVNFILDDEFEGVRINGGWNGYQHKNDNGYIQGLLDQRGFDYEKGDSGVDGISRNLDIVIGGNFGEKGHATAWGTWRKNAPLFQAQRDYSSCALNAAATRCGGSATADPANFYVVAPESGIYSYVSRAGAGAWSLEDGPTNLYNFAPINYYQRPDERYTAGTNIKYEINEYAKPYLEAMFVNRRSSTQLAPSGAFFTDVTVNCDTPQIGTLCNDTGITDDEFTVYVAKRNVEGGPRFNAAESNNFSVTSGVGGSIWGSWSYDASFTYNRASNTTVGTNDFLTSRIRDALLGCPDGAFDGCVPYEVFTDSVTPAQAQALQGISQQQVVTDMRVVNGYVTGDLGVGLPTAGGEAVSVVLGYENRTERYAYSADSNLADGNFAGSGSESPPIKAAIGVEELFMEGAIPLLTNAGILSRLDADVGYRFSQYELSGDASTYKIGFGANFFDDRYKLRGGFNRAIRAPNINELFLPQQIGLWGGTDPCAGATPEYTAEQCALTGVTPAQYGSIAANPAAQYNQIAGGNQNLTPEKANTWTLGVAAEPVKNLIVSVDYYQIKIEDAIGGVGARNLLDICALTGQSSACSLITRNPTTGDLFRGTSGFVTNFQQNLGSVEVKGIDLSASYTMRLGPGRLSTSIAGTYLLDKTFSPLQSDSSVAYDCTGNVSPQCSQAPEWRHLATARYSIDRYTAGVRWRYFGALDYKDPRNFRKGRPLTTDTGLVKNGGVDAYNWFDINGSVSFGPALLTAGINNVFDKEPPLVGSQLTNNGNALGGYDQLGRYLFTSLTLEF